MISEKANGLSGSPEEIIANITKESQELKSVVKPREKLNIENWKEVLGALRINPDQAYKEPPVCIELNATEHYSRLATFGNFSAVIGKAKSRKTFFISLLLSAAIKQDHELIKVSLPAGKERCVFFDTEQSAYDVWKVVKRILNTSEKLASDNFEAYGLRTLAPKERLLAIQQFLYNNENIGLVVIDGIRDLVNDINSPEEATEITSHLLKWTEERDIHIITALHQNKGDNNARGHLGTEIVNKAETVLSIEKDNEISIVNPEFVRDKDFNPFAFSIDAAGIAYVLNDWAPGSSSKASQKITAYDIERSIHIKALKEVFSKSPYRKYKELESDLKVIFQSYDIKLSNVQVVEFIAYYRINNMVKDTGGKGRTGNQYSIHESITL